MQRESAKGGGLVHFKIGLNAGEPVQSSDDLFGAAVTLTNAIANRAEPDLILTSQVVRDLTRSKKLPFTERPNVELPGIDEPMRLFEVEWRDRV